MSTTRALQPEQDLEAVIRYGTKPQSSVMTLYRPSSGTMPVPLYERQTCHGPKQALWSKMGMSPDFWVVYSTRLPRYVQRKIIAKEKALGRHCWRTP